LDGSVGRRRSQQLDRIVRGDGARRMVRSGFLHQVISRGPIAMTIEQRADDAAAQHSRKGFLISLGLERRDDFIATWKAANVQTFFIRRTATKAGIVWRVSFLETLFVLHRLILGAFATWREIFSR